MGIVLGKTDSRRISFDNSYSLMVPALVLEKAIEHQNEIGLPDIAIVKNDELMFTEKYKNFDDLEIDYWSRRLDYLKKEHQSINKIVEKEFEKELETKSKIFDTPQMTQEKIQKLKPCYELRKRVVECYAANPSQPLLCSSIVQAFKKTVCRCRDEL